MALLFVALGVMGLLGSTTLFPLLAASFGGRGPRSLDSTTSVTCKSERLRVTIAIPTCGERQALEITLQSVSYAISYFYNHKGAHSVEFDLLIGIDGKAPQIRELASQFQARVLSTAVRGGKWKMLERMARNVRGRQVCTTDPWIVFADVGVQWPKDFLITLIQEMADEEIIGLAPTYSMNDASVAQKVVWSSERLLKTLENLSGGPVSVHGATVAYKIGPLLSVFDLCVSHTYANDDVVIPLLLRAIYPTKALRYLPTLSVFDNEHESGEVEQRRRTRMLLGNAKWIQDFYPFVVQSNHRVAVVALRRIFRVLWAYWIGSLTLGGVLFFFQMTWGIFDQVSGVERVALVLATAGALSALALLATLACQQLLAAAKASLLGPWYWGKSNSALGRIWK